MLFFIDKKTMIITKHKPRRHAARRTSTGFCRHFYLEREPPYERALQQVLRDSDARVARFMEIQILDRNDPFFGGFPSADSIAEPKVASII